VHNIIEINKDNTHKNIHTNIKWFDVKFFVFHVWFELRLQGSSLYNTKEDIDYLQQKKTLQYKSSLNFIHIKLDSNNN
jgi:hypothetical protein